MTVSELKAQLTAFSELNLRFALPGLPEVPAHAHVTEVARVEKRFVDCGGTLRSEVYCRLQTWVADDLHHRLGAGKLLKILNSAAGILGTDDPLVDIEHEAGLISQFPLESIHPRGGELVFQLGRRHTACLAEDQCKRPAPSLLATRIDFKPFPRLS